MSELTIRYAELDDIPAITDIYNDYVLHTTATFDITPRSVEDRTEWFYAHPRKGRYRLLAAADAHGVLAGFTASNPLRTREAYDISIETTVYVARNKRYRGIGLKLYQALFQELAGEDIHRAYACISLPNPASIALHQKTGFSPVGIFHEAGKKFDQYISVQWMEKRI